MVFCMRVLKRISRTSPTHCAAFYSIVSHTLADLRRDRLLIYLFHKEFATDDLPIFCDLQASHQFAER